MRGSGRERLPLIDAMRTIAAAAVVFYHAENLFCTNGLFRRGYLFVDLFFLISGFVLTLSIEKNGRMSIDGLTFFKVRFRRFLPMTAIGLVNGALLMGGASPVSMTIANIALGLVMVPNLFSGGDIFPLNSVQWSLMQELLANIAHGFVLKRMNDRQLAQLAGVLALLLIVSIAVLGENTGGPGVNNWWQGLPRGGFSYVAGMLLARRRLIAPPGPVVSWQLSLLAPVVIIVLINQFPTANWRGPVRVIGDIVTCLVLFPWCLWVASSAPVPARVGIWLRRAGGLSFPIYAVHLPIIRVLAPANEVMARTYPSHYAMLHALALVASFAAASVIAIIQTVWAQRARRAVGQRVPQPS